MSTFNETVIEFLVNRGMFENQANEVFEKLKGDKGQESMQGRWQEPVDDYPPIMVNLILLSTKRVAVEWIDENVPLVWYRPMFL